MRLLEFQAPNVSLRDVLAGLGMAFQLERVGGNGRIYNVNGAVGAIFIINGGPKALGITWDAQYKNMESVYVWNNFMPNSAPDAAIDIPNDATLDSLMGPLKKFIEAPHVGLVEGIEDEPAVDVDPVPDHVEGSEGDEFRKTAAVAGALKGAGGGLALVGRRADGTYFELPHKTQAVLDRLEDMMSQHFGPNEEGLSMEEQYENLKEQIGLVAQGKSRFIKSLLITGAPSSGKTYTVMKTLDELGLVEGKDYMKKKGHVSTKSLYRLLIEQVNGMLVFDDCDSVVEEGDKAENMLKGALDTDPVREVDYDVARALNTAVMSQADRIAFVDSVSRILRGVGTHEDVEMHRHYLKKNKDTKPSDDLDIGLDWTSPDAPAEDASPDAKELFELQQFFSVNLPNKIDFRGRIIFISNHKTEWWAEPIRTRAFIIEMNFSDGEMLDYIRTIKKYIQANITEEQKDEVLNFIEQQWKAGSLKSPINFRLVQSGFDLRLTRNWKNIIAAF